MITRRGEQLVQSASVGGITSLKGYGLVLDLRAVLADLSFTVSEVGHRGGCGARRE